MFRDIASSAFQASPDIVARPLKIAWNPAQMNQPEAGNDLRQPIGNFYEIVIDLE